MQCKFESQFDLTSFQFFQNCAYHYRVITGLYLKGILPGIPLMRESESSLLWVTGQAS
jgi:hypothetical protein